MNGLYVGILVLAVLAVRLTMRARRRARTTGSSGARRTFSLGESSVALVAAREIRERVRGRIFRVGTLIILVIVAAAIVIPSLHHKGVTTQRLGVVGTLSAPLRELVAKDARSNGYAARFVDETSLSAAQRAVRSGSIDGAIVDSRRIVVETQSTASDSSEVQQIAYDLGVAIAVSDAHLNAAQTAILDQAHALPISSLKPHHATNTQLGTTIIGIILIFIMLSQYNTWTLIGVMEEKSSRVIEVLLSAVRPLQLLTGKVLGIGLVAFAQAALVVAFALVLAKSVGSSIIHGAAPLEVASILVWLLLGYAFYCWVYAAAGSMTERQDQVQSLALPLSLPLIFGYVVALTSAGATSASLFIKVLAYLPPTAPFEMTLLVGLGQVTWWQFLASALISIGATVVVARFAASVYRRAILRTGGRVRVRDVLTREK